MRCIWFQNEAKFFASSKIQQGGYEMITIERTEILTGLLTSDEGRAKRLLALEPDEAMRQINDLGYDFTQDEIIEYGKALKAATEKCGELDLDALDEVAGGILPIIPIAIGLAGLIGAVSKSW